MILPTYLSVLIPSTICRFFQPFSLLLRAVQSIWRFVLIWWSWCVVKYLFSGVCCSDRVQFVVTLKEQPEVSIWEDCTPEKDEIWPEWLHHVLAAGYNGDGQSSESLSNILICFDLAPKCLKITRGRRKGGEYMCPVSLWYFHFMMSVSRADMCCNT